MVKTNTNAIIDEKLLHQEVPFKMEVSNIKNMTDAQLNDLKVGDVISKKTGQQKHNYIVTYKQENHGICLTYVDASVVETVSYDFTQGHWVYNSTDVTELGNLPKGSPINWIDASTTFGELYQQELTDNSCGYVLGNVIYLFTLHAFNDYLTGVIVTFGDIELYINALYLNCSDYASEDIVSTALENDVSTSPVYPTATPTVRTQVYVDGYGFHFYFEKTFAPTTVIFKVFYSDNSVETIKLINPQGEDQITNMYDLAFQPLSTSGFYIEDVNLPNGRIDIISDDLESLGKTITSVSVEDAMFGIPVSL